MNKLKRILATRSSALAPLHSNLASTFITAFASVIIAVPACWADGAFKYSAVTLSYARESSTLHNQEPQRLSADLSIEVSPHGFIYAGTQSGWAKYTKRSSNQSVAYDMSINTIQLGYGGHYALSHQTDIYGRLGLLLNRTNADIITRTNTSINTSSDHSSATGIGSELGLRSFINSAHTVELTPSLQLSHIDTNSHPKASIAISYHPSDKVQIQIGYNYDLETKMKAVSLDFRIYGKSF